MSTPTADQIANLVALSDERDLELRLRLAAEAAAYQRGLEAGRILGYAQAERDMAAAWAAFTKPIARGPATATVRLSAAAAGERRDAAEHWQRFVAEASAAAPERRTEAQRAMIALGRRRGANAA